MKQNLDSNRFASMFPRDRTWPRGKNSSSLTREMALLHVACGTRAMILMNSSS